MGCLTLGFIEQVCINLVIIFAVVAFIKLLVPLLTGFIGIPIIAQIINIVLWAIVAIICIYVIFGLLSCLLGSAHLGNFR